MKAVSRDIQVRIADLEKYSNAMRDMASVMLKPWEQPDKRAQERITRFRWWAATNKMRLDEAIKACQAEQEKLVDAAKIEAYQRQRDLIHRAYAKRDKNGQPMVQQDSQGRTHYIVPEGKQTRCVEAIKAYDETHPEIGEMRERVEKYLAGDVTVRLVCCDFRDVAFEVNGLYAHTFREIILHQPKMTPWWMRWVPAKYRVSPQEALGVLMLNFAEHPGDRKAAVDALAKTLMDECSVAASLGRKDATAAEHPLASDPKVSEAVAERMLAMILG